MKNTVKHLEAYLLESGWKCDNVSERRERAIARVWQWEFPDEEQFPEGDNCSYTMKEALYIQLDIDGLHTA